MGFIQFMTREQVVEKYSIPPDLETEIFAVLRPAGGSGVNARYLESLVDKQMHQYFEQKDRLQMKDVWSYPNKESDMKQTWADTVEGEGPSLVAELSPLLVDEKTAAELLGVSRRTVFELNEAGKLPCKRIGSRKLYSVTRLRDFAEGKVA